MNGTRVALADQPAQEDFWSRRPCGIDADFIERRRHRYRMVPWLPAYLNAMCGLAPSDILEVG